MCTNHVVSKLRLRDSTLTILRARARRTLAAGLVLTVAATGCGRFPVSNLLWFEATAEDNATVLSQGPGRTLTLRCDDVANGQPCRWNVRMLLRNTEALASWSLSLLGESGSPLLEVTDFNYVLSGFTTPVGGESFGPEPDLLLNVGANTDDPAGAPADDYILLQFTLVFENPANGPEVRTILAAFGDDGWAGTDPDAEIPPLVQIGGNIPAPAVNGVVLPFPAIVIDHADDARPGFELCGDGADNDGDGREDCDDNDCRNHFFCRVKPTIDCPANLVVECDGQGNAAAVEAWLDSVDAETSCENLTVTNNFDDLTDDLCGAAGTALVTFRATDSCGSATCTARVTIEDTIDPELTVPDDFTFTCADGQSVLVDWLESATAEDDCGDVDISFARGDTDFDCTGEIVWTALDDCGNDSSDSAMLTIEGDEEAPEMSLNGDEELTLECGVDEYEELGADVEDDCDATLTGPDIGGDEVDTHTPGEYVLTYDAQDLCGREADQLARTVTVVDTLPPRIELKTVRLWPPNHQTVTLNLSDCVRVIDDCEGELDVDELGVILSAYSDEPENATGDGNTTGDLILVDDSTFRVRVERRGMGNGRVYGITFEIEDSAGHRLEDTCLIEVPHDMSGRPAIDDGPGSGYTVAP